MFRLRVNVAWLGSVPLPFPVKEAGGPEPFPYLGDEEKDVFSEESRPREDIRRELSRKPPERKKEGKR